MCVCVSWLSWSRPQGTFQSFYVHLHIWTITELYFSEQRPVKVWSYINWLQPHPHFLVPAVAALLQRGTVCVCVSVQSRKPSLAEVGLACETTCETSVCVCVHASIKALTSMIERPQGQFCTLQSFYVDSTPTPSPIYIFLNWLQPHPHFLLYSVPARAAYITTIYE